MKISLVRIGNSQGIRIPSSVIKQCGFEQDLDLTVKNKSMIVTALETVRGGWEELSEVENTQQPFDEKGDWEWSNVLWFMKCKLMMCKKHV